MIIRSHREKPLTHKSTRLKFHVFRLDDCEKEDTIQRNGAWLVSGPRFSVWKSFREDHIEFFWVVIQTKQNHYIMSIFRTRMGTHPSTSQPQMGMWLSQSSSLLHDTVSRTWIVILSGNYYYLSLPGQGLNGFRSHCRSTLMDFFEGTDSRYYLWPVMENSGSDHVRRTMILRLTILVKLVLN